jgi:integrase
MPRYTITGALTPKLWSSSKSKSTKYQIQKIVKFADGSSKRLTAYGTTKTACIDNLHAKAQTLADSIVTADTMTFRDAAVRWLSDKKRSGRKYGTIYTYSKKLNTHLLPALSDMPLHTITFQHIESILFGLTDEGKYRTAEQCRIILNNLFKWAMRYYRDDYQLQNPVDYIAPLPKKRRSPNSPQRANNLWTDDQLKAFLNESKRLYDQRKSLYYPFYLLAIGAGLRRSELIGLSWRNVYTNEHGCFVDVVEQYVSYDISFYETPKTEHGTREIPISKELYNALLDHRQIIEKEYATRKGWQKNNLVFPSINGTPITERNVYRSLYKLIRKLGLPKITPHDFRRLYSSHLANAIHKQGKFPVKIIQQRLGHARSDVSMEVYVKMLRDNDEPATVTVLADESDV